MPSESRLQMCIWECVTRLQLVSILRHQKFSSKRDKRSSKYKWYCTSSYNMWGLVGLLTLHNRRLGSQQCLMERQRVASGVHRQAHDGGDPSAT